MLVMSVEEGVGMTGGNEEWWNNTAEGLDLETT